MKKTKVLVLAAVLALAGCSADKGEPAGFSDSSSSTETTSSMASTTSTPESSSTTESTPESSSTTESAPESSSTTVSTPETSEPDTSTSEPDTSEPEEPKWIEELASGTYYINTQDAFARAEAIMGAAAVKRFDLNDQVTVTAKTDTGYYKLTDGSFVHGDYISNEKTVITQPDPPASSTPSTPNNPSTPSSSSTPSEPKTPTDTTGMTLDENGFPANPSRGDRFVDKDGNEWASNGRGNWSKIGGPSTGSTDIADWAESHRNPNTI